MYLYEKVIVINAYSMNCAIYDFDLLYNLSLN